MAAHSKGRSGSPRRDGFRVGCRPFAEVEIDARLFDGKADTTVANAAVFVEGARIKAVGSGLPVPPLARVIDLGDATLLLGVHRRPRAPDRRVRRERVRCRR